MLKKVKTEYDTIKKLIVIYDKSKQNEVKDLKELSQKVTTLDQAE